MLFRPTFCLVYRSNAQECKTTETGLSLLFLFSTIGNFCSQVNDVSSKKTTSVLEGELLQLPIYFRTSSCDSQKKSFSTRSCFLYTSRACSTVRYDYKDIKELEIFLCQPATTNKEQVIFMSRLKKNSRSTRTILQSARSATRKTRPFPRCHFLNFFGNENFDVYLYEFCIY